MSQDLTKQGAMRQMMKELKAQVKAKAEELKKLRAEMPHVNFGKKRVEIGDKGQLLIYGLQKFPVSLYANQVFELKQIINDPTFKKFIEDNKESLATKEKEEQATA